MSDRTKDPSVQATKAKAKSRKPEEVTVTIDWPKDLDSQLLLVQTALAVFERHRGAADAILPSSEALPASGGRRRHTQDFATSRLSAPPRSAATQDRSSSSRRRRGSRGVPGEANERALVTRATPITSNSREHTPSQPDEADLAAADRSSYEAADAARGDVELATAHRSQDQAAGSLTLTPADIRAIASAVVDELRGRRMDVETRVSNLQIAASVQQPPRLDPATDLDDETWMRQCVDERKRWALRGRELDAAMRDAASPGARADALAALQRHETEYESICRRQNEVDERRAKIKIESEIASEGWDRWLRRVTKERDEIRAEGWDNWYRRRVASERSVKRQTSATRPRPQDSTAPKR